MGMKHILLTGGRAPVALELARQLARQGHHIIVAESVPVHLCRTSRYVPKSYLVPAPNQEVARFIDALIQIIQQEHIDLLIPTCEEIFFIAHGLERLQEHCAVFVAPLEQLRGLHSKWEFIQRAQRYGLNVPATHLLTSRAALRQCIEQRERSFVPFVLKPVYSRFATQVIIVERIEQAMRACEQLTISEQYPWIAQERIVGQAYCSYSLARQGKLLAHVAYAENFTAGRGACISFQAIEQIEIDRWIEHFVASENFTGQIAFDFIVNSTGQVYPLECNPRATSGLHLFQVADQLDRLFLDEGLADMEFPLTPDPARQRMLAAAMLCYGLAGLRSWSRVKAWLHIFWHAHDVIFDVRDIRPFLSQLPIIWYNWQGSRKFHTSMLEYSTRDIEWNGQT